MDTFPAYIPLSGCRVVIVGEGEAATNKARLFEDSPVVVERIALTAARDPEAFAGAKLVFIAAAPDEAADIIRVAKAAGALVNAIDLPDLSDFVSPSIVDRGRLVIGIGTSGAAPVIGSWLRSQIETVIPPGLSRLVGLLAERRKQIREALPEMARRRAFFRGLLTGPLATGELDPDKASRALEEALAAANSGEPRPGRFWAIETPADLGRLSLSAVQALNAADIAFALDGAGAALSRFTRRDAECWMNPTPDQVVKAVSSGLGVAATFSVTPFDYLKDVEDLGAAVIRLTAAPAPW